MRTFGSGITLYMRGVATAAVTKFQYRSFFSRIRVAGYAVLIIPGPPGLLFVHHLASFVRYIELYL